MKQKCNHPGLPSCVHGWMVVAAAGCTILGLGSATGTAQAASYYVSPSGSNSNSGTSSGNAWQTIGHACNSVPSGIHTINIAAGTYQETQQCVVEANWTIKGAGPSSTKIYAPTSWDRAGDGGTNNENYYIFKIRNSNSTVANVTIQDLELRDSIGNRANGGIFAFKPDNLLIDNINFYDFRYSGAYIERGDNVIVRDCRFEESSSNARNGASRLGNLMVLYLEDSEIYNNVFVADSSSGYGYRGRGHTRCKVYNNDFRITNNFDIEVAHENEYGLEIYDNRLTNTLSLVKSGQQQDPSVEGESFSIKVYRNFSTSREFVEGSRGWMEICYNYVTSTNGKTSGRFYTDFGSIQDSGGTKIHHNVIENNQGEFIFIDGGGDGRINDLEVYNNTVFFKNSGNQGIAWNGSDKTQTGWKFKNNAFVAASGAPRGGVGPISRLSSLEIEGNVFDNITTTHSGNLYAAPAFHNSGGKPYPYYRPASGSSSQVNVGVYIGFPHTGSDPDAGAYGHGLTPDGIWLEIVAKHSGKRIDVSNNSTSNGAVLHQWAAGGGNNLNQQWRFDYLGSGYYKIVSRRSGKVIDVKSGSTANGAAIQQWAYGGGDQQRWKMVAVEDGRYFRLQSKKSGKVIDVPGASTTDGKDLKQYSYHGGDNQRWRLESP